MEQKYTLLDYNFSPCETNHCYEGRKYEISEKKYEEWDKIMNFGGIKR
jgi:hypothetical protein